MSARPLAEAVRDLPGGLVARPLTPHDVPVATAIIRAVDISASGASSTNEAECHDMFAEPECRWGAGAALIERGDQAVALLVTFDGVQVGRGWHLDVYIRPGDPGERALRRAMISAGLAEGQQRWAAPAVAGTVGQEGLVAKTACFPAEVDLLADLASFGFAEVRRFWRMAIRHDGAPLAIGLPEGYTLRPVQVDDGDDRRLLHHVATTCFADHYDFAPVAYDPWWQALEARTEDPSQWWFAETGGQVAGYVRGSDRFASEGMGYVASLGVLRAHRGRGLAGALLRSRFADDAARGRAGTLLHVDSASPTGATRVYESAGMVVDEVYVAQSRPLLDPIPR